MNHESSTATNKRLVLEAIRGVFIDRDKKIPSSHFSTDYKQHNPLIPDGSAALPSLIDGLGDDFSYEPGMIVSENEYVMIHGRQVGWGLKPLVAVDIFRIADGKLAEHWDVMQEEVPPAFTKSGNAMFTNPQTLQDNSVPSR